MWSQIFRAHVGTLRKKWPKILLLHPPMAFLIQNLKKSTEQSPVSAYWVLGEPKGPKTPKGPSKGPEGSKGPEDSAAPILENSKTKCHAL